MNVKVVNKSKHKLPQYSTEKSGNGFEAKP